MLAAATRGADARPTAVPLALQKLPLGLCALALAALLVSSPAASRAEPTFADLLVSGCDLEADPLLALPCADRGADLLMPSPLAVREFPKGPVEENPRTLRSWIPLILLVGAASALHFAVDPPEDARWDARNGFDMSIRSGLRLDSGKARRTADALSSAFLAGNAALLVSDWVLQRHTYPLADSIRRDSTWMMGNVVVTRGFKLVAARERPFVRGCDSGAVTLGCANSDDRNASFFSNHTSLSSTIAGLLCARHLHRPERSAGDLWLCGAGSALAVGVGLMRISADKHYATDVLAGWASGFVFGYALPTRLYYGQQAGQDRTAQPPTHLVTPLVGSSFWGLRYDVSF